MSDIKRYNFKSGLPLEFEVLDVAELYRNSRELMTSTHRTDFYHIIWFKEGKGTHLVDFKPHAIKSNSLLFINKNKVQRFDLAGQYKARVLLFTDSFFCKSDHDARFLKETILFNDLFDDAQVQLDKDDNTFADLLNMMEDEWNKAADNFQHDLLKNMLHNFLLLAERKKRKQGFTEIKKGADLDYTLIFKDLLEIHFRKRKQVSYFAREISITEKRLNSATSKTLGITPKEMIDERIVLEAKRLLSHTGNSIKEIGFELGFEEPTNFIKYFRKHCNCTPVEFREEYSL
ncbi:MAG: AraC family transcriptional regulator [Flavobacteriales bacterium]